MNSPLLLDVNVLIALFDSAHIHHAPSHAWFARAKYRGWRTCPIVENGFLRILSHSAYPNGPTLVSELAARLEEFKALGNYEFWPDDFSLSHWINQKGRMLASATLTDAYLLKLAADRQGALATFDLRLQPSVIDESDESILEHIPI